MRGPGGKLSPHVLAVVAYDSQLKWAMGLLTEFRRRGWSTRVVVPVDVRHSLSAEQVRAAGADDVGFLPWSRVLAEAAAADGVVLAVQGPLVERFTDDLHVRREEDGAAPSGPVVIAGWVGIIIEKIIAGYLDRCAADLVAVNSADNLRDFRAAARLLGIPDANLLLSGLPLLPAAPAPVGTGPLRTVLFADQPTVPAGRADRAYLYQRLADYARAHPDRQVLLRPRHRPGEGTFHVMRHHPETVLASLPPSPDNFAVTYEPITSLLPRTDLLLTVSSTAGLEAVGAGVRTAFIGDLGVHEKHGNHVLLASGLLATFDDLEADRLPTARRAWLDDLFVHDGDGAPRRPAERIVDRAVELHALPPGDRPGAAVAASAFVRGRIAVRTRRRTMPPITRVGAHSRVGEGRFADLLARIRAEARRRAYWGAQALLPRSWVERLRQRRYSGVRRPR
ncbi:DUF6716 putative glycosyltransferase [Microbacterium sp.]|uniref:DUF6716 putative glycosyltransferase n=1 Tax=Microbacterium sp. TaxID=51671 RepID=UPI0039E4CD6C